jgi:glycosyltransferase involved in cell wall biosynthesis
MRILFVHISVIPASRYGGRERALWWLAKELHRRGHQITFLAPKGSSSDFARVIEYDFSRSIDEQIPESVDLVHLHFYAKEKIHRKPYVVTIGGNGRLHDTFTTNSIFLTRNHAERHGAEAFVFNGLDTDEYGKPDLNNHRKHVHFLAKAAWKVKNVRGAIYMARKGGHRIEIIGGDRLNLKMGFRFTLDPNAHFNGIQGGEKKFRIIQDSKALLFPVLWHEPFGIAMIESMYYGCPVFGTPWGSLPEIVTPDAGFLSDNYTEHIKRLKEVGSFNRKKIHELVCDRFSAKTMTDGYLACYEKALNGQTLNPSPPKVNHIDPPGFFTMHES